LVFFIFASKIRQLLITSEACCHFAPPTHFTNQIQREFLFNDAIQSQKACCHFAPPSHAQNFPKKFPFFSNFLKLGLLSLRAADKNSLPLRSGERAGDGGYLLSLRAAERNLGVGIAPSKEACCHFAPPKKLQFCKKRD
jgi:hypothetical protein